MNWLRTWIFDVVLDATKAAERARVSELRSKEVALTSYSTSALQEWRELARDLSASVYSSSIRRPMPYHELQEKVDSLAYRAAQGLGVAKSLRAQAEAAWTAHAENGALRAALLINAKCHLDALNRLVEIERQDRNRVAYAAGAKELAAQIEGWEQA